MSTNSNTRLLDSKSVAAIMTKRQPVSTSDVGETRIVRIQGNGNVIDVTDKDGNLVTSSIAGQEGVVLQKKIFNCKANSQLAMTNARTRQHMIDGLAAEKAGDTQKAHEEFNAYLNSCQLSFGVLLPSAKAEGLSDGVKISADIIKVTTENGSLLTIDPTTIAVQQAGKLAETTGFSLEDFAPVAASSTAKERKAVKA